ncbi:MAG: alpha/beta fold hydrolase [Anaerolineales bacterium]|nr:alpha/beta fold hydrolase [Anaerolineales bacterium]
MNEVQIEFTSEGQRIFGMLHLPDGDGSHPAVALFHGFTGTRVESHRLFVKTARALAHAGLAALRFDFRGSGESEGEFVDMTVQGEIADASRALDFLSNYPALDLTRLGILGLSLGGLVGACLSGDDPRVKALALWSTPDMKNFGFGGLPDPHSIDWDEAIVGEWLDWGGNRIGRGFFKGMMEVDPLESVSRFRGPVLVVHGTSDAIVPLESGKSYEEALAGRVEAHWIEDSDHTYSSHEWESNVIGVTVDWFRRNL